MAYDYITKKPPSTWHIIDNIWVYKKESIVQTSFLDVIKKGLKALMNFINCIQIMTLQSEK
jgi:hypothetical protein